jgi:hypothetical protein
LPSLAVEKKNIFTMPEFPTLVLQLMFAGSIFYVGAGEASYNLVTTNFQIDGTIY